MMGSLGKKPGNEAQLRYQARKQELKISKRGELFSILEYSPVGDFWVPIEDCWGSFPHCLSFDEAAHIVREYV
jgi:hypothetical protein